jgi:hypothetical protein
MSASPPKAAKLLHGIDPPLRANMQCSKLQLFDQLVGAQQERFRDFQAEVRLMTRSNLSAARPEYRRVLCRASAARRNRSEKYGPWT